MHIYIALLHYILNRGHVLLSAMAFVQRRLRGNVIHDGVTCRPNFCKTTATVTTGRQAGRSRHQIIYGFTQIDVLHWYVCTFKATVNNAYILYICSLGVCLYICSHYITCARYITFQHCKAMSVVCVYVSVLSLWNCKCFALM